MLKQAGAITFRIAFRDRTCGGTRFHVKLSRSGGYHCIVQNSRKSTVQLRAGSRFDVGLACLAENQIGGAIETCSHRARGYHTKPSSSCSLLDTLARSTAWLTGSLTVGAGLSACGQGALGCSSIPGRAERRTLLCLLPNCRRRLKRSRRWCRHGPSRFRRGRPAIEQYMRRDRWA